MERYECGSWIFWLWEGRFLFKLGWGWGMFSGFSAHRDSWDGRPAGLGEEGGELDCDKIHGARSLLIHQNFTLVTASRIYVAL